MAHKAKKASKKRIRISVKKSIKEHKELLEILENEEIATFEKQPYIVHTGFVDNIQLVAEPQKIVEIITTDVIAEPHLYNVFCESSNTQSKSKLLVGE